MEIKNTTKIVLAWELFETNVPKTHIAERVGVLGICISYPLFTTWFLYQARAEYIKYDVL